jgi:hypothetical protein
MYNPGLRGNDTPRPSILAAAYLGGYDTTSFVGAYPFIVEEDSPVKLNSSQ